MFPDPADAAKRAAWVDAVVKDHADPLLRALDTASSDRKKADTAMRQLVAYARELHTPAYARRVLAEHTGLSGTGIRTFYGANEITAVTKVLDQEPGAGSRSR